MMSSMEHVSFVFCSLVIGLAISGAEGTDPKRSSSVLCLLILAWFLAQSFWLTSCKSLEMRLGFNGMYPSTPFWLTFIPMMMMSLVLLLLCWVKGINVLDGVMRPVDKGVRMSVWYITGAHFCYGQLFTLMGVCFGTPVLVFASKALEPISTALLAVPMLGQSFSMSMFGSIIVSCIGIALTTLGAPEGVRVDEATWLAIIFAMLSNLTFSIKQCGIKKVYQQVKCPPTEALAKVTLGSTMSCLFMAVLWDSYIAFGLPIGSITSTFATSQFNAVVLSVWTRPLTWFRMSAFFFFGQYGSLLILDCVSVESHALLTALKHILTAVVASICTGSEITFTMMVGLIVACAGILMYSKTAAPENCTQELLPKAKPSAAVDLPGSFYLITFGVLVIGLSSPMMPPP